MRPQFAEGNGEVRDVPIEPTIEPTYDNALRKLTGSYYTPPEVVEPMVRLVDDVLRRHFGRSAGLASTDVTLAQGV